MFPFSQSRLMWLLAIAVLHPGLGCAAAQPEQVAAPYDSIQLWANNGEDKVTRQQRRLVQDRADVKNSVWDGKTIRLSSAQNETIAFNLVVEAPDQGFGGVSVAMKSLDAVASNASRQFSISSREVPKEQANDGLFDYRGRNIEWFLVRYLTIEGCSVLAYEHYDERHVPERMRRPHNANGIASGSWKDRPDHDQAYPDIAVPLELHPSVDIAAMESQSFWCDIYVPSTAPPGLYRGNVTVTADGFDDRTVPVELTVHGFALPELPSARTMLYISQEDLNERYIGRPYIDDAPIDVIGRSRRIIDRHFQMAHRHRISLIHEHTPIEQMDAVWMTRLDGSLFTPKAGYEGPGQGVGNNVVSIGTYGAWPWKDAPDPKSSIWRNTDAWVNYFDGKQFATPTQYFLYVADESDDYPQLEQWAKWVSENPGPGGKMPTLVTLPLPKAMKETPSVSLPTSTVSFGITDQWRAAVSHYRKDKGKSFFLYNGGRPGSGTMVTEDDGVAMRQLAWCQYKFQVPRWFFWSGTYYKNYQGSGDHTKLFSSAQTFGGKTGSDDSLGKKGWNYNNGDGVLFYPGTDRVHEDESYQVDGPIASLRMKHWRRGLQDFEYLTLASKIDPNATKEIVQRVIPRVLWEVPVTELSDPTWTRSDISWSTDPDDWEAARMELVRIIESGQSTNP